MRKELVLEMPELHPMQQEVWQDTTRHKVLACGRRWGKTLFGATIILQGLFAEQLWFWVAPTYSVSRIAFKLVKALLSPVLHMVEVREAEGVIRYRRGEIAFRSGDRPDNLRGVGLHGVVIDEAAYVAEELWTQVLRPALADKQGRAVFLSSPRRQGDWFHNLYLEGQRIEQREIRSWQLPSWTNPYLPADEIAKARQDMPSIDFAREFGAEFVSASSARIKPHWLQKVNVGDVPELGGTISIGVDLAISTKTNADYTALVVVRRVPSGALYVLDTIRERLPFDGVLNLIKRVSEKWKPFVVAIEQVQFQAAVVQELHRTTSLPVIAIKPEGDKLSRFLPLEVRYEQQKVYHTLGVTRDFESELTAFPDSTHDDMIDAFSYAWLGLARITISSLGTTNHNVSPRHKYFSGAKNGKRNRLSGYYK